MKKIFLSVIAILIFFSFFLNISKSFAVSIICIDLKYRLTPGSTDYSTNGEVTKLQNFLIWKGYKITGQLGTFGPQTTTYLREYHLRSGIFLSARVAGAQVEAKLKFLFSPKKQKDYVDNIIWELTVEKIKGETCSTNNNSNNSQTSGSGTSGVNAPVRYYDEVGIPNAYLDMTPRIAYWYGKVNQHINTSTGLWETDPTGKYGALVDKLSYCKLMYPNTASVVDYKMETIYSWRDNNNTGGPYTATVQTYKCVQNNATENKYNVSLISTSTPYYYGVLADVPENTILSDYKAFIKAEKELKNNSNGTSLIWTDLWGKDFFVSTTPITANTTLLARWVKLDNSQQTNNNFDITNISSSPNKTSVDNTITWRSDADICNVYNSTKSERLNPYDSIKINNTFSSVIPRNKMINFGANTYNIKCYSKTLYPSQNLVQDMDDNHTGWISYTVSIMDSNQPQDPIDQTCWDGSKIPMNQVCPIQYQTCSDGSRIPITQACPQQKIPCWDGSFVYNIANCPIQIQYQTCSDGSRIPANQTCPSNNNPQNPTTSPSSSKYKSCSKGAVVNIGETCPYDRFNTPYDGQVLGTDGYYRWCAGGSSWNSADRSCKCPAGQAYNLTSLTCVDFKDTTAMNNNSGQVLGVSTYQFQRTLKRGSSGDDVLKLQKVLNSFGYSLDNTGYFGDMTKAALIKFQEANADKILYPVGLTRGTGEFGKSTMNYINNLFINIVD